MVNDNLSFWSDIKRYEDELNADPSSYCFIPLAELYLRLGLVDDAVSVARKGCALHPDCVEGLLVLGAACHGQGLTGEARDVLEQLLSHHPHHVPALKLLGQVYADEGNVNKARELLEKVLAEDPGDSESALLLRSLSATAQAPPEVAAKKSEEVQDLVEEIEALDDLEPLEEIIELEELEVIEELDELEEMDDLVDLSENDEPSEPSRSPSGAAPVPPSGAFAKKKDPLMTSTLAELYRSQGFIEKALSVYRELQGEEPDNLQYRRKIAELEEEQRRQLESADAEEGGPAVERLAEWLENIRSRRNGI